MELTELGAGRDHALQGVVARPHGHQPARRHAVLVEPGLSAARLGVVVARPVAADGHDVLRDAVVVERERVPQPPREHVARSAVELRGAQHEDRVRMRTDILPRDVPDIAPSGQGYPDHQRDQQEERPAYPVPRRRPRAVRIAVVGQQVGRALWRGSPVTARAAGQVGPRRIRGRLSRLGSSRGPRISRHPLVRTRRPARLAVLARRVRLPCRQVVPRMR